MRKEEREKNKRQPRITNRSNSPLERGAHYLRKNTCEPILSPAGIQAELHRRKELSDAQSELERRLRALRSSRTG
jgi:two-component sensor histidine kinase